VAAAKALKNAAELAGMREAHLRDAVALAETFSWLEQQVRARPRGAAHEHLVLWRCIPPRALWPLALPSRSFGTSFHPMAWPRRAARWPRRVWM